MSDFEEAADNADDASKPVRKLTDADFAEAVNLYELGKAGITELAARYGCSRQNLSDRFKRAGVKKSSRVHELTDAAAAASRKEAEEAAAAAQRFANRRADMIEEVRMSGLNALKQARMLAQKSVVDAVKSGRPVAIAEDDLKSLQRFNKLLVDNIESALRILKADDHVDDTDLPNLVIANLTDEEILNHHKSTGALPEDATLDDLNLQDAIGLEDA